MSEQTADAVRPGDQDGNGTPDNVQAPTSAETPEMETPSADSANETPTEDQGSGSQLDQ